MEWIVNIATAIIILGAPFFAGYMFGKSRKDLWLTKHWAAAETRTGEVTEKLLEQTADANKWLRQAVSWRKRALYLVQEKCPGETREETCIRLTQDALQETTGVAAQTKSVRKATCANAKEAT